MYSENSEVQGLDDIKRRIRANWINLVTEWGLSVIQGFMFTLGAGIFAYGARTISRSSGRILRPNDDQMSLGTKDLDFPQNR